MSDGYYLYYYEVELDECVLQTDECGDNADCKNINGSYICICQTGYKDVSTGGRIGTMCEGKELFHDITAPQSDSY